MSVTKETAVVARDWLSGSAALDRARGSLVDEAEVWAPPDTADFLILIPGPALSSWRHTHRSSQYSFIPSLLFFSMIAEIRVC